MDLIERYNAARDREAEAHLRSPLGEAKRQAGNAEAAFRLACKRAGFADEWEAYRAELPGSPWPDFLDEAHREWMRLLHAFYLLRDGPRGVLGGRGL